MITKQKGCILCNEGKVKHCLDDGTTCNRCIYDDEFCFAILALEQYTVGHTLVILKDHKTDITCQLSENALSRFMCAIHMVAVHLKKSVQDNRGNHPERIYVNILCDGVKHLHAHLIPRYPFTEDDKTTYRDIFMPRDGALEVAGAIKKGDLGGFWYVAEREKNWESAKKPNEEKRAFLEQLAKKLRF